MLRLLITSSILVLRFARAQNNLLYNGGFEICSSLPDNSNEMNRCSGWSNCNGMYATQGNWGSPDFLSMNGSGVAKLPCAYLSCIFPHSGNNVAGFITYNGYHVDNREYIRGRLSSPMQTGATYFIDFYITRGANPIAKYVSDNIGFKFSIDSTIQTSPYTNMQGLSHFAVNTVITNTTWQKFSFQFTADSAYRYVTIGNFMNDANTTLLVANPNSDQPYTYYAIDDISIVRSVPQSIDESEIEGKEIHLYPNPAQDKVTIKGTEQKISIYDVTGREIYFSQLGAFNDYTIELNPLEEGIYFVRGEWTIVKLIVVK